MGGFEVDDGILDFLENPSELVGKEMQIQCSKEKFTH